MGRTGQLSAGMEGCIGGVSWYIYDHSFDAHDVLQSAKKKAFNRVRMADGFLKVFSMHTLWRP